MVNADLCSDTALPLFSLQPSSLPPLLTSLQLTWQSTPAQWHRVGSDPSGTYAQFPAQFAGEGWVH